MLYNVNMSQYAHKSLTDVSAAVLYNTLACICCCISGPHSCHFEKISVQISALEPVTIIFFWKHATLIMVENQ